MINNLHVRNLALIDEADIDFTPGLNVLTGETGAGKSIIIGSLGLALGDRADSDAIRTGSDFGLVELSITPENPAILDELSEYGIDKDTDEIIIKRRIYPGRSDCRINGEAITLKELSRISSMLIDICGQRESLKLLKETSLKQMLDDCGGTPLATLLKEIKAKHTEYTSIISQLEETDLDEGLRKRKADLAEYEINEIDEAALVAGEDEDLENSYRVMSHSAKITESMSRIASLCNGNDSASDLLSRALREIRTVSEYDERLSSIETMLTDLESLSSDLSREVHSYMTDAEFDPYEFEKIEKRLDLINRLKDKYGSSIEQILNYRDERANELEKLVDYESYMNKLCTQRDKLYQELIILCNKAHSLRVNAASNLELLLMDALKSMNFLTCNLQVSVTADEEHISATGYDHIDFLISMNPGEPLKPLSSVASGGELSRIMLAIKCVTGNRDSIGTMVFDEIDTGISGVTAWKVGEKMNNLSQNHQLICITHQAQIAAQADTHFLINKSVSDNHTTTSILPLDRPGMIVELARMMGSDETSSAALSAAEELKNKAGK